MSDAVLLQPDVRFIRSVVNGGGGDLKKCYQCATCSVVCTLSPDHAPFPRRQMIRAQWGLKGQLMGDPAIWLCHNCGDCTTRCPRGARPGDVFGALRSEAIKHFAIPGVLGSLLSRPAGLAVLFLAGAVAFGLLSLSGPLMQGTAEPRFEFADMFPLPVLEAFFFALSGLLLIAFAGGLVRFTRALRASGADGPLIAGLIPAVAAILTHRRFGQCGTERTRFYGHLATLWGFLGLAAVGTVVGVLTMAGLLETPLAQTNPLKILANASGAAAIAGVMLLLGDRLRDPVKRAASTPFDWFFAWTLAGVLVSGMVIQFLRLAEAVPWMYVVYYVHLVLIFALFVGAPYTKFAHLAYRTVAMAAAGRT
ncbi:MAG: quinone-interacting membrane-bound oxidoreductase complex subunit QmoC [Acidobacteriota bacterium]